MTTPAIQAEEEEDPPAPALLMMLPFASVADKIGGRPETGPARICVIKELIEPLVDENSTTTGAFAIK